MTSAADGFQHLVETCGRAIRATNGVAARAEEILTGLARGATGCGSTYAAGRLSTRAGTGAIHAVLSGRAGDQIDLGTLVVLAGVGEAGVGGGGTVGIGTAAAICRVDASGAVAAKQRAHAGGRTNAAGAGDAGATGGAIGEWLGDALVGGHVADAAGAGIAQRGAVGIGAAAARGRIDAGGVVATRVRGITLGAPARLARRTLATTGAIVDGLREAAVRGRIAGAVIAGVGQTVAILTGATVTGGTVDAGGIAGHPAAILAGGATGIAVGRGADIAGGAAGTGAEADAVATAIDRATRLGGAATGAIAHLRLGTAGLFAGADRSGVATGVVTALGRSVATGESALHAGRTDTGGAIPDLVTGAGDRGGSGSRAAGSIDVVRSGQWSQSGSAAQAEQPLEDRPATGATCKRAYKSVESPIVHALLPLRD